jgi:FlaA1/EpsC-like NDP-sugar epimerase
MLQKSGVGEKASIVPVIGDMKDRDFVFYILGKLRCDVIFHCAAYKHVPLMEENPVAVIQNNVFGTKNLLDACLFNNVHRFVLISTDKAVLPRSAYGVSKLLCERLVMESAARIVPVGTDHAYMFVRFGNVLGSRGSVLPLFLDQIKTGGPLTVTHREMNRYFMTIPEACSLVLQTGGVGKNGESYLLDMGAPIRIYDLAEQVIRYYGYTPVDGDAPGGGHGDAAGRTIPIVITGLRKGERLDEPLWVPEERPEPTAYPKILRLTGSIPPDTPIPGVLEALKPVCFLKKDRENQYRSRDTLEEIIAPLKTAG